MAVATRMSRTRRDAATLRIAASSAPPHEVLPHFAGAPGVAPVASGYERGVGGPSSSAEFAERASAGAARVSRAASTIHTGGDR